VRAVTITSTSAGSPGERGVTTVAPAVFERIAARAASEVDGVEGTVSSGLGRFLPWADEVAVEAEVDVDTRDQHGVALDLALNVAYPRPVGRVAEDVRDHVIERIGALTGRSVRQVNITVVDLLVPTSHRRVR
jgi:uncharacterized alkaline shock family protein YloU